MIDHTCSYRIKYNVAGEFKQVIVFIHQDPFIAALENVTNSSMSMVKILGIDTIELAHSL